MFDITNPMTKFKHSKTIIGMLLMVALLITLTFTTGCGVNNPADGSKIGQIVKVTKSGVFSKTWEAEIIRGGMTGGSGAFSVQPFDFTIESEEQAKQVQDFMDHQTEVIITYHSAGIYGAWRSDTGGHFLKTIAPATNSAPAVSVTGQR